MGKTNFRRAPLPREDEILFADSSFAFDTIAFRPKLHSDATFGALWPYTILVHLSWTGPNFDQIPPTKQRMRKKKINL